jgi:hypothetical protein
MPGSVLVTFFFCGAALRARPAPLLRLRLWLLERDDPRRVLVAGILRS